MNYCLSTPRRALGRRLYAAALFFAFMLMCVQAPALAAGQTSAVAKPTVTVAVSPSQMTSPGPAEVVITVANPAGNPAPLTLYVGSPSSPYCVVKDVSSGGTGAGRFTVSALESTLGKPQQLPYTYVVGSASGTGTLTYLIERREAKSDITLTRTFSAKVVGPGKTVKVSYEATNVGTIPLSNIVIGDDYFGELVYVANLQPKQTVRHEEDAKIEGDLISSPYVKYTNPVTGSLETVKVTPDVVRLEKAQLRVTASLEPQRVSCGEPTVLTLTLANEGNLDYRDLAVSGNTLPDLAVVPLLESTRTFVLTRQLRPFEARDYAFTIEGKDSAGAPIKVTSEPVRIEVDNPVEEQARWSIKVTATPNSIQPRQMVTFEVNLHNDDDQSLTEIVVDCAEIPGWQQALPNLVAEKTITVQTQVEKTTDFVFTASAARHTGIGRYTIQTEPCKVRVLSVLETPSPTLSPAASIEPAAEPITAPVQDQLTGGVKRGLNVALWIVGGLIVLTGLLYVAARVLKSTGNERT